MNFTDVDRVDVVDFNCILWKGMVETLSRRAEAELRA
jgi:hypothetical protein